MAGKNSEKAKKSKTNSEAHSDHGAISTKAELKSFLLNIRDKMADGTAAPVYALGAINHAMNIPEIYDLLDKQNKELARDVWLRIKQAGFKVKNPTLLFEEDEELPAAAY